MASSAQPGGPAWFVTEFGASSDPQLLASVTAQMDARQVGWAYWSWKYYGDPTGSAAESLVMADGRLRSTAARAEPRLSRRRWPGPRLASPSPVDRRVRHGVRAQPPHPRADAHLRADAVALPPRLLRPHHRAPGDVGTGGATCSRCRTTPDRDAASPSQVTPGRLRGAGERGDPDHRVAACAGTSPLCAGSSPWPRPRRSRRRPASTSARSVASRRRRRRPRRRSSGPCRPVTEATTAAARRPAAPAAAPADAAAAAPHRRQGRPPPAEYTLTVIYR